VSYPLKFLRYDSHVAQKYSVYIARYLIEVQNTTEYGSHYKVEQEIHGFYKYICLKFRRYFNELF